MEPPQIVFIGIVLLIIAYLFLRVIGFVARRYVRIVPDEQIVMSSAVVVTAPRTDLRSATEDDVSPAETNPETAETPHTSAETVAETFTLGETTALARLIVAEKIGLTDAVKIGAGVKSGEAYQKRSRQIKAAVEQLKKKYPDASPTEQAIINAIHPPAKM